MLTESGKCFVNSAKVCDGLCNNCHYDLFLNTGKSFACEVKAVPRQNYYGVDYESAILERQDALDC